MKCQHCGVEVATNAAFCQGCGQSLTAAAAKPAVRTAASADPGKQAFATAVAGRGGPEDAEEVLWEGRFSKLAMLGSWIAAAVITLAAVIAGFVMQATGPTWMWIVGALAAVWIVLLVRLIYLQLSVHYRLTSQRFVHERGLLWRQQDRIETIDVDDVTVLQGPVQRMLGIGTVQIVSSDSSTPRFLLVGIENVRAVASLIDDTRRKERRRRGVHIESV